MSRHRRVARERGRRREWGRSVPLETRKTRIDAKADRLARAGATRLRLHEAGGYFVLLQDPEGNEFCVH